MERKVVLLVDDNELNRKVISKIVESLGYEPISAASGVEAVQIFHHSKPDLILMDCRMPDMDGFETTKIIRRFERINEIKKIPVIAVSASDKGEEWERCVDAGMDDFISKPVDVENLAEILEKFSSGGKDIENIDVNALMISADHNYQWAGELLKMFVKDTKERISEIELMKDYKNFNVDVASRDFHTIKSSAASVGAVVLKDLAEKMEDYVKNGELSNLFDNLPQFKIEFERSFIALENEIAQKKTEKP